MFPSYNHRTKLKPACHYLAGYALDHAVALKLDNVLTGRPNSPSAEGHYKYPLLSFIQNSIMKDLKKDLKNKGLNFEVEVKLVGTSLPWGTLIVTQGGYDLNDPSPEVVEGEKEEIFREWLQAKGDFPAFPSVCCPLTLSIGLSQEEYRWEIHFD
jgi:hypothetical protein